jgi:hypothetical protein
MNEEPQSRWTDPDQVRAGRLASMGSAIGPVFSQLSDDLIWLHVRWGLFTQLFSDSSERVSMLNEAAGGFFYVIQEVLWQDVLLGISRLTDPAGRRRQENLSLYRLMELVEDERLKAELSSLNEELKGACAFARAWRNKRIAHRDRATASGEAGPLPPATKEATEAALRACDQIMNHVERHYLDCETGYAYADIGPQDASALVEYLRWGLHAERIVRERRGEGHIAVSELEPSGLL